MKNIINTFTTLLFYLLCVLGGAALLTASAQTAAAKEYKADVITEIENSDFNQTVITSCISQAQSAGYTLAVTPSADADGETVSADVVLSYSYKIPIFGIEKTHMTRGKMKQILETLGEMVLESIPGLTVLALMLGVYSAATAF